MSDTFSGIPWFVATRPQKFILWLRHWWVHLWLAAAALMLAGQIIRWGFHGFVVR